MASYIMISFESNPDFIDIPVVQKKSEKRHTISDQMIWKNWTREYYYMCIDLDCTCSCLILVFTSISRYFVVPSFTCSCLILVFSSISRYLVVPSCTCSCLILVFTSISRYLVVHSYGLTLNYRTALTWTINIYKHVCSTIFCSMTLPYLDIAHHFFNDLDGMLNLPNASNYSKH